MMNTIDKPRRGRPKKNQQAHQDTKEVLLQAGLIWLTKSGFTASGLDAILRSVGIPKGSFYYYFDSKEVFGLAIMERYKAYFEHKLDKHLLDHHFLPLQRLENFMVDAQQGLERYDFERGCLVGNLEQEVEHLPEEMRSLLLDTYASWELRVASCLLEAQKIGEISSTLDVYALANIFWLGWEGAVSRSRLVKAVSPITNFSQFFVSNFKE